MENREKSHKMFPVLQQTLKSLAIPFVWHEENGMETCCVPLGMESSDSYLEFSDAADFLAFYTEVEEGLVYDELEWDRAANLNSFLKSLRDGNVRVSRYQFESNLGLKTEKLLFEVWRNGIWVSLDDAFSDSEDTTKNSWMSRLMSGIAWPLRARRRRFLASIEPLILSH